MAVPFGKYQLLRKIASGGMGQIFLALEQGAGFERLVVLKLILPHLAEDEDFLTMFLDEARLVARLAHPNLITILDLTEIDGRHCLAMEYVQGEDVRRLDKFARNQGRPLPVGLALRIIAEAAAGLHHAHQARDQQGRPLQLVHRDVSPQNILVGFDGGVKVIDFGVAKAAGSASHTATGVLKGKYPYMSPEQANGQDVDARSDLFALGVVLWELLTNRRLFKGDTDMMTLRLVRDCQVPQPSQLQAELPPGLDELVLKALARTPEQRFPDCGAFRLAIEDYILQHRLPASNAHLSAWLRELYAERISREEDPSTLDQLAEDTDLDSKSNSSRSSVRSHAHQQVPVASTGTPTGRTPSPVSRSKSSHHTQTLAPDTVTRRRFPVVPVVAGLGTLLVVAGAAIILLRQHPARDTASLTNRQQEEQAQLEPQPEQAPEPQPVTLKVISEPTGALVLVDGKQYGETPMDLPLEPDAPPVTLALRLDGYEPVSQRVSAGDAPEVSVKLTPKITAQKPPRRPNNPPLDIKMGR
ncbi:serine/threonine-protein kinase [Vitiosangium sp. GDMCC 1.1324]|uniref:serine/threonine protein kinase n=1 Tax=Vitiosangium sp. (strain GDMCC 1.1324) TaxID=2138576 RepID=UPI000D3B0025|nr:serine/threonine-protein kinase [Vitiosangium sp. GDMCC 1.1324]PTL79860.1 protein kinase [Vitiosangium sp. GDMCC 1.1324]